MFEVLNDMKESFIKEFNDDIKRGLKFIFRKEEDKVGETFYNISYVFCYITEKELEEEINTNKTEEEKEANEVKKANETNETEKTKEKDKNILEIVNILNRNDGMSKENLISKIKSYYKKNTIKKEEKINHISFKLRKIKDNNNIEETTKSNDTIHLVEQNNEREINNEIKIDDKLLVSLYKEKLIISWIKTRRKYKNVDLAIELTKNKLYIIKKSDKTLLFCLNTQYKEKSGVLLVEPDKKETKTTIHNIVDFQIEYIYFLNYMDVITKKDSKTDEKNNYDNNKNNNNNNNNINENHKIIDFSNKDIYILVGGYDKRENKSKIKLFQALTDENKNEEIVSELEDYELSNLNLKSGIININQKENEIIIYTKETIYELFFEIN